MGTGINETGMQDAGSMMLDQNYPNPFVNSTTIKYYLPSSTHVILTVNNMLGRQAAVLADGMESEGWHTLSWDSGNAASGIYFCRLIAGSHPQTIKMILIK